ncbi:MAG: hypothetical protein JKY04_01195 [Sneathiella sp.]|nr:hypothetical protein [Sneathiella sp.]
MGGATKSVSILIALLFLFNLFATLPLSLQHSKDNGSKHSISTELFDPSQSQIINEHQNIEHCGMASCAVTLTEFIQVLTISHGEKMAFSVSEMALNSLIHAPPGRPPLA